IDALANAVYTSMPFRDKSNCFWLLSWPWGKIHLYRFDMNTKKLIDLEPALEATIKGYHETFAIKQQQDGTMWVYGGGVFVKFNEKKMAFEWVEPNRPGEFSIRY